MITRWLRKLVRDYTRPISHGYRACNSKPQLRRLEERLTPASYFFSNPAFISVPGAGTSGPAAPYPSDISVAGLTGFIFNVNATISGYTHAFPDDVNLLLSSPGTNVELMRHAGGGTDIVVPVDYTFADGNPSLSDGSPPSPSGTYSPSQYGTAVVYDAPAPAGPYGVAMASFNFTVANGTWSLYAFDDAGGDAGSIAGGWSLRIDTFTGTNFNYDASSNPTITDYSLRVNGTDYEIFETANPGHVLASQAVAGTTNINITGQNGVSDLFTVDYAGGVVTAAIGFDGGTAGGTNTLQTQGGAFLTADSTPTGAHDGTLQYNGAGLITYSNLSPMNLLAPVATLTINASANADIINVVDGPIIAATQTTQVNDGGGGTFELVNFANATSVTVNGLTGVDTFTLNNPNPAVGMTTLTLDSGIGADTVNIQRTTVPTLATSSGDFNPVFDAVSVGLGGNTQFITSSLNITNPTSFSDITIDDSADGVGRNVTVSNGSIVGIAPVAITYATPDIHSLTVNGGTAGNTITVTSTSGVVAFAVVTTINAGTGTDTVNVQTTNGLSGANLEVQGQSGSDVVNIGSVAPALGGGLGGIQGAVTIRNTGSFSSVNMDDTGDVVARVATLDTVTIGAQTFGRLNGLGNLAPIQYAIGNSNDVSTVTINAGSGGNTITVNQAGATGSSTTNLNTGVGTDVVNVQATSPFITYFVAGQNGNDSVNFGSTAPVAGGDLTGIQGRTVVSNTGSFSTIDIDDSGDAVARNATLDSLVSGPQTFGRLSNLGNTGSIEYAIGTTNDTKALTIHGGSGGNTITINQSGGTGAFTTTFNTGTGADEVDVQATSANIDYIIQGQSGGDTVNVGSTAPAAGGTLTGINGLVQIQNTGSTSAVTIDDSGDATGRNATLDTTVIGAQTFGRLVGLGNTAAIQYAMFNTNDVNALTISGGSGGNTITVNQAPVGGGFTTTLNSGTGADVVNVQNTSANITYVIEGQGSADSVNVGSTAPVAGGTLAGINGVVQIHNTPSTSAVDIDDSGDAVARVATIDTVTIGAQTFGRLTGLGNPAEIDYAIANSADVSAVTIHGGSGGNTYTVDQTGAAAAFTLKLDMGTASDTATVTPDVNVTFNVVGQTPTPPALPGDTLNVNLAGTTSPKLTSTTSGTGLAGAYTFGNRSAVNFQEIETLSPAGTDVSISITDGKASAIPGAKNTYTIVVVNNGPLVADTSNVTTTIPAALTGVTFTAVQSGGVTGFTAAGNTTINDNLTMPIGSSVTYTLTGTIASGATGNLAVTANVASPAGNVDPVPANNTATDTDALTPQADLGVVKDDSPDPVFLGSNITYTITVTTKGLSDAQTVALSDNVPANTTFVSFSAPAGWTTNTPAVGGTGLVTATRPTLVASSGAQVFTLVVRVNTNTPNSTLISNTAAITSATTDPVAGNNTDNETTLAKGRPLPLVTGADAGGGPHVIVYDSNTGNRQFSFYAYDPAFSGGVRVAAGDVTGDGFPDILTAAGPGGGPHVKVFDGVTGAEVRSFFAYDAAFNGGVFVGAGDVNGDGFADIITGADAGGGPHVRVIDGKTGAELYSFFAYSAGFFGGVRVAGGDVDGDGKADIVTGAGPSGGPHVEVFSGATGAMIRSFFAFDAAFTGGVYVAAGDFNGDNKAEIVVGAGAGGGPQVVVVDGTSLAVLASFAAYDPAFHGGVRVGVADVNADGNLDLLTGAGPGGGPHVQAFDAATQTRLKSFYAYDPAFTGGVFVG